MPDEARVKAAQAALGAAVEEVIRANEWDTSKHGPLTLTSWVLVAHQAGWTGDGDSFSAHPVMYMGGEQPDHVALGLLQVAQDTVRGVGRWSREDDEDDG